MRTAPSSRSRSTAISRHRIAELRVQCQQDPRSENLHREAIDEFMAAGLTLEALPLLRRLATLCPDDAGISTRLGTVLAQKGEHREAVEQFQHAARLLPNSARAFHDLGVAACAAGEYAVARDAFEQQIEIAPESYEVYNDLAVLYSMDHRYDDAAEAYRRCLKVNPRYEKGQQNALQFLWDTQRYSDGAALTREIVSAIGDTPSLKIWMRQFADPRGADGSGVRPVLGSGPSGSDNGPLVTNRKIAFVATSDTFLRPIAAHFAAHNEVRTVQPQSSQELAEIMRWADLTWYEWCDAPIIQGSQLKKSSRIVCRLHSYEAFTDFPSQVNWRNVDRLILVNRSVGEILDMGEALPVERCVIPNGIDPGRFPMVARPRRGRKIASVGYINYKKNPSLLLQTFKALHDWDPAFELHIAGTHQDPRIKVYWDHLVERLDLPVTFHGWVEDMPSFYAQMDYVISTSLFESFHYSIAEGMLSGCLPLIHSWKGADYLYPSDALFDTPADARALIERYEQGDTEATARSSREHIIDNYNWTDRLRQIDRVLHGVLMGESNETTNRVAELVSSAPAAESQGMIP